LGFYFDMTTEPVLTMQGLGKSFGDRQIFSDLSLGIHELDKIGIVGINGCGKSTLLKCIGGIVAPTSGEIVYRNELKISYLAQDLPRLRFGK
jgi:ATP-binding cassette subfamily F protein uup